MEEKKQGFLREYYIYDLANNGSLVTYAASAYKGKKAEGLFDALLESDRQEWETYLKSYCMTPAIADTCMGPAIVLPYLMPAASLVMVCIPRVKRNDLIKLALRDPSQPILLGEGMRSVERGRLHDASGEMREEYGEFMKLVRLGYGNAVYGTLPIPGDVGGLLCERLQALSRLLDYPVRIKCASRIMNYGEVDVGYFLAYLTVMLSMAKMDLPEGEVAVTLEEKSYGCSVSVMLSGWKRIQRTPTDVLWMDVIASRKRILFEVTVMPDGVFFHFSPMSKDWSYLGLKQDVRFDWCEDTL